MELCSAGGTRSATSVFLENAVRDHGSACEYRLQSVLRRAGMIQHGNKLKLPELVTVLEGLYASYCKSRRGKNLDSREFVRMIADENSEAGAATVRKIIEAA